MNVEQRTVPPVDSFGFDPRAECVLGAGLQVDWGVHTGVVSVAGANLHRRLAAMHISLAGFDCVFDVGALGAVGAYFPIGRQCVFGVFE